MNIFVLDENPQKAASYLLDKHVIKMPLESAQMLCLAFPTGDAPYKGKAFKNHPCTVWAHKSRENYMWLIDHAIAACEEYTYRYGKTHGCLAVIIWCKENIDKIPFDAVGLTEFVQVCPDHYKSNDTVSTYRNYYLQEKARIAKWSKREIPIWWVY